MTYLNCVVCSRLCPKISLSFFLWPNCGLKGGYKTLKTVFILQNVSRMQQQNNDKVGEQSLIGDPQLKRFFFYLIRIPHRIYVENFWLSGNCIHVHLWYGANILVKLRKIHVPFHVAATSRMRVMLVNKTFFTRRGFGHRGNELVINVGYTLLIYKIIHRNDVY